MLEARDRIKIDRDLRQAAEQAALRAQRERGVDLAKEERLNEPRGNEITAWEDLESLIESKKAASYDQAVSILVDLRDLAEREGDAIFELRLLELRDRHIRKTALIRKMLKAVL